MFEIIPNWHPIFVHFTVALLSLAAALFVLLRFVPEPLRQQWETVARWNLWIGAAVTVLTGITGFHAYNTVAHDVPSHLAMTVHHNLALITIMIILLLAVWSVMRIRAGIALNGIFLVMMLVTGMMVAVTAWHGAEVVYRYGVGVMSLPSKVSPPVSGDQGADHHDHAH